MAKTGLIIVIICFCFLLVVGGGAGLYYGNVACPSFGASCSPAPSPGTPSGSPGPSGTPAPAPSPITPPSPSTPQPSSSSPGTPSTCAPGNYLHDGSCTPCGYNAYKSTSGTDLAECLSCPAGTVSWNVTGTDASTCKKNCVGSWGPCQGTCGTGQQTYTVTDPGEPGGMACPVANGQTGYCQLPNACDNQRQLLSTAAAQGSATTCPLSSDGQCNHNDDCPNFNNGSTCADNGFGLKCCT